MDATGEGVPRERLRRLHRANASVVENLELDVVLRRVVEAAMSITGARYGALGVLAATARHAGRPGSASALERFVHVGMDDETAARIPHLPRGEGVLGAVIESRVPIRLPHIADDPRSAGFPAHHPPMDSFLGVPVRVRSKVYGNLYLADAAAGAFTAQDEEAVVGLAATAGIAIENARLYAAARTREAWQAATADVMGAMIDTSGQDPLSVIVERIGPLVGASLVTLAVPTRDGDHLRIAFAHGTDAAAFRGRVFSSSDSLGGRALRARRAVQVAERVIPGLPPQGPTVAIPLFAGDEPLGVLTLIRPAGAAEFGDADVEMGFVFAVQAGVAIEVVRGREDRRRLESGRSRARIARDLHDHVIQRLYGSGLALDAIAEQADAPTARALAAQLDELDAAVKEIRTVILALGAEEAPAAGVRERLLTLVAEASGALPSAPRLRFSGPIDTMLPAQAAEDLPLVLTECLDAITAHTPAATVDVALSLADGALLLRVAADGPGAAGAEPPPLPPAVERRAIDRGASAGIDTDASGYTFTWSMHLPEESS